MQFTKGYIICTQKCVHVCILFQNPIQINFTNENTTSKQITKQVNATSSCSLSSWGKKISEVASCDRYSGRFCGNVLTEWHQCVGLDGEIHVEGTSSSHVALDEEISKLEGLLSSCT